MQRRLSGVGLTLETPLVYYLNDLRNVDEHGLGDKEQ